MFTGAVSRWAVLDEDDAGPGEAGPGRGSSSPGQDVSQGVSRGARSAGAGQGGDMELLGSDSDSAEEDAAPSEQPVDASVPRARWVRRRTRYIDHTGISTSGNSQLMACLRCACPCTVSVGRYDMKKECRAVELFEKVEKISEGTYGVVYKVRSGR